MHRHRVLLNCCSESHVKSENIHSVLLSHLHNGLWMLMFKTLSTTVGCSWWVLGPPWVSFCWLWWCLLASLASLWPPFGALWRCFWNTGSKNEAKSLKKEILTALPYFYGPSWPSKVTQREFSKDFGSMCGVFLHRRLMECRCYCCDMWSILFIVFLRSYSWCVARWSLYCISASEANKTIKASKAITGNQRKQAKHAK